MQGSLIFLMGVSGSGKSTVISELEKINPDLFQYVPSVTTRQPRPGELEGLSYNFVSEDKFVEMIKNDEFLEYAKVHNSSYYGTSKKLVMDGIFQGKLVLKTLDMNGLLKLKANPVVPFKTIFLDIDQEIMKKRIVSRAPISDEELLKRLQSANFEKEQAKINCDLFIDASGTIPDVVDLVYKAILTFIKS